MSDYVALRTELLTDPVGRGYAGKTDQQAADLLLVNYKQIERPTISNYELFEAIADAEFVTLTAANQARLRDLFNLGDRVPVATGSRSRTILTSLFNATSATRANLVNLVRVQVRRCDEIGWSNGLGDQDVAAARAMRP